MFTGLVWIQSLKSHEIKRQELAQPFTIQCSELQHVFFIIKKNQVVNGFRCPWFGYRLVCVIDSRYYWGLPKTICRIV